MEIHGIDEEDKEIQVRVELELSSITLKAIKEVSKRLFENYLSLYTLVQTKKLYQSSTSIFKLKITIVAISEFFVPI